MRSYQAARTGMLRGAAYPDVRLPPWPDLSATPPANAAAWACWLREVWSIAEIADAVEAASPEFADTVRKLCAGPDPRPGEARRAIVTMIRYVQRIRGRCTPAGLMAGVATVRFGPATSTCWAGTQRAIARAGAEWLAEVISLIERNPALLARLPAVANTALISRGDRLIVPHQPAGPGPNASAADISIRRTAPVQLALTVATAPVSLEDIAAKVRAEYPEAAPSAVSSMLEKLVGCGALITSLHAPGTHSDGLTHLISEVETTFSASAHAPAGLTRALTEIRRLLQLHNQAPPGEAREIRRRAAALMHEVARTRQHPLAIDLRLGARLTLPDIVAREAERAAMVLTRLAAHPAGTPAWKAYHQRFYERYGLGSLVPVLDMVSDSGIGWPDGYPGAPAASRSRVSRRDELLLGLAQEAVLDGREELALTETELSALEVGPGPLRPPPHLELGVRIQAAEAASLRRGDFELHLVTVSRGAGVLTGRFLPVLRPADRAALADGLAGVPCGDQDTVAVQLSFPPLDPATAHVTRAPQIFPDLISLGEHHPHCKARLTIADLAVGCDGRRMYLAVPGRGTRVEALAIHALNLTRHTPPLARLLIELSRAQCAQVTMLDWGAAACLPYLPRVRAGRAILAPARWLLAARVLPGKRAAWQEWSDAVSAWLEQRHVPRLVHLTESDQSLPLDLAEDAHRAVLRAHLANAPHAVLTEAPGASQLGWCGGRPHEIILPVCATEPPRWPALPAPVTSRAITRDHGHLPGTSRVLLASLYGDIARQDDILAAYLPDLLTALPPPARWWYIRYRDHTGPHIRLRITLPAPDAFGTAARTISTWAGTLRNAGLLREVRYPADYPETGRWGSGPAWAAAEAVFEADSSAIVTQLALPRRPPPRPLAAAHAVSIAAAFTGGPATGMRWLADHVPAAAPARIPRPVLDQARLLADPSGDWTTLKSGPGGEEIASAWADRDRAVSDYRTHLPGPDMAGIRGDDVLSSLLHVNFVRGHGIDFAEEAACLYLARAAALTWHAREGTRK